jgi:F0F1-type ATP synthase membrane subunit b/b'
MLQKPFTPARDDSFAPLTKYQPQAEPSPNDVSGTGLEILAQLDQLEEKILAHPRLPLTGKTMVDEEELIEQIDAIRFSIPVAVQTAQKIIADRERILLEAQQEAQKIVLEADRRAYQIANELGIIHRAEQEAKHIRQMAIAEGENLKQQTMTEVEQMRQVAMTECQQIQADADQYADRVLGQMESQLQSALQIIQRGRQKLQD